MAAGTGGERQPVIVLANCQGAILAWIFNHCPTVARGYHFVHHINFHDRPSACAAVPMELRAASPIFIDQIGAWGVECAALVGLPADAEIIRIPAPFTSSLFPLRRFFPDNTPLVPRAFEIFWEFGDKLAIQLIERGLSRDEYLKTYFATDIGRLVNCERLHELDIVRSREQDLLCDIQVTDYIVERYRKTQLYHTVAHLTDPFYFDFAGWILNALVKRGIPLFVEHEAQIRAEMHEFQVSGGPLHSEVQIPIHPHVAESMRLEWYEPDRVYRNRDFRDWTFPEFIDFLYDYVKAA